LFLAGFRRLCRIAALSALDRVVKTAPTGDDMDIFAGPNADIAALFETHEADRFDLHKRRLNEQMVRVLKTTV
jgi:hypothetical protein